MVFQFAGSQRGGGLDSVDALSGTVLLLYILLRSQPPSAGGRLQGVHEIQVRAKPGDMWTSWMAHCNSRTTKNNPIYLHQSINARTNVHLRQITMMSSKPEMRKALDVQTSSKPIESSSTGKRSQTEALGNCKIRDLFQAVWLIFERFTSSPYRGAAETANRKQAAPSQRLPPPSPSVPYSMCALTHPAQMKQPHKSSHQASESVSILTRHQSHHLLSYLDYVCRQRHGK